MNFVFSLLTFLCLQSSFFGKFQSASAVLRETMFFCLCLSQRVRTTLSLSGVEGGWHGATVDTKWEKPRRETLCTHTPGSFSPVCIVARGRAGKGGRYPSTCVAVLSWLQMLSVKRASCGSYGGILWGGCLYRGAHHCFSDLGYISLVSFKVHQFLPLSPLLGSSCPTGSLLGSGTLKIAPTCLYNPFHCTLGQRNLHILAMPVGNLTHW